MRRGTASSDPKDWPSSELAGYAWKESFLRFDAVPGTFENDRFYLVAKVLEDAKTFVGADDEEILAEYVKPR